MPYLDPSIGSVSAQDPGALPANFAINWRTMIPSLGAARPSPARQIETDGDAAWLISRDVPSGAFIYEATEDGTWINRKTFVAPGRPAEVGVEAVALVVMNTGGRMWLITYAVNPSTGGWTQIGNPTDAGEAVTPFDTTAPVRIGTGWPAGARVYGCEKRASTNPATGAILWRFDPAEYPGSGETYEDPRGVTWTLSDPNCIVTP